VTLVEPKGPVNVGHVARLVRNFGVQKLYLVNPRVDMSVAATYASHASDVLDSAVVTTFARVREEHDLLVATTAVKARRGSNVIRRSVKAESLGQVLASARTSSLVFGRDSTGLTNEEIRACDVTTTLETEPGYRALNLGHAVAILLYLTSRGSGAKSRRQSRVAREVFARSLRELGEAARAPGHRTESLFETGKRIAATSGMTDRQLNLLSGVLRKAVAKIDSLQESDSKT
jgi:tRNA/rRNA methyltransferase